MPKPYGPFRWLARLARFTLILALAAIALALTLTVAHGVLEFSETRNLLTGGLYLLAVLGEIVLALLLLLAYAALLLRATASATLIKLDGQIKRLHTVLEASQDKLASIADLGSLSDQAKAMIYHDREIEAVQEIVHACLLRQQYDQAETLINRMEQQLGHQEQAARLREAVAANRQATAEGKIAAAVERVNKIIAQKHWDRAVRETRRLLDAFPDNRLVAELTSRIAAERNQHKSDLLKAYDEAVQHNDVDRSIELLRELDRYLPPPEAAALKESARGVFRAKLHNLGVNFALAVNEERWTEAAAIGGEIVNEFPNSRMATEVGQKLDALKQLARTPRKEG